MKLIKKIFFLYRRIEQLFYEKYFKNGNRFFLFLFLKKRFFIKAAILIAVFRVIVAIVGQSVMLSGIYPEIALSIYIFLFLLILFF